MTSLGSILNTVQIGFGSFFVVLTLIYVAKTSGGRIIRAAAYVAFLLLLGGLAFGKYYASTAPKRLRPIEKSNPQAAIKGYTEAIRLSPSDSELYARRGWTNLGAGDASAALNDFTKALDLSPSDSDYLFMRGLALLQLNDISSAERDFKKAVKELKGKEGPEVTYALATIAGIQGRADDAIKFATDVLARPGQGLELRCSTLLLRASVYSQKNDATRALADLNAAYNICENKLARDAILVNRGNQYAEIGEHELALQDLTMALHEDPNDYLALYSRGGIFSEKGDFTAALQDLDHAIQVHPEYPEAYSARAQVYFRLNQKDRAEEDLRMANKYYNNSGNIRMRATAIVPLF